MASPSANGERHGAGLLRRQLQALRGEMRQTRHFANDGRKPAMAQRFFKATQQVAFIASAEEHHSVGGQPEPG